MAQAKTNRDDVVANFNRYRGRAPKESEEAVIQYLMTKPPQEVEQLLAKDSKITGGLLWAEYQKQQRNSDKEAEHDPYKTAEKYGYSRDDFANDPNFVSYWSKKTPKELETALQNRADFNKAEGRKNSPEELEAVDETQKWIDDQVRSGIIDQEQADIISGIIQDDATSGQKIYSDEEIEKIASDAELLAKKELDPYYEKVSGQYIEDLRNSYADLRNSSLRYQQQEAKSYAETLEATKASLRARNMTFSGTNRKLLGSESAIGDAGREGDLEKQRRYNWEDQTATWQEAARNKGIAAERYLGSANLDTADDSFQNEMVNPYRNGIKYDASGRQVIYSPAETKDARYIGTGNLDLEKKREIERLKQDKIEQQRIYT